MLRVLIVEDEIKICNLIIALVDWENLGYEIVGIAENGIEGEQKVNSLKPDVVITDIRMPGCDGIELVSRIRSKFPDTVIVFISGYKHFDYAHSAIKYGVKYYLLKPIQANELENILIDISRKHTENLEAENNINKMNDAITRQRAMLHNLFVTSVCSGFVCENTIQEINKKYYASFSESPAAVLLVKCDRKYSFVNSDNSKVLTNVMLIVDPIYSQFSDELLYDITEYGLVIIFNYKAENRVKIKQCHNQFLHKAAQMVESLGSYSISFGIGKEVDSITNIVDSFKSAVCAIRTRILNRDNVLLSFHDEWLPTENASMVLQHKDYLTLLSAVRDNDKYNIEHWFMRLEILLNNSKDQINILCIYGICKMINFEVIQMINSDCREKLDADEMYHHLEMRLLGANTLSMLLQIMSSHVLELTKVFTEKMDSSYAHIIKKASFYIEDNYRLPLKIEDVASYVHLNPTYFSEVFKSESGSTFLEFLTNTRIENAKKLLRETNCSVVQIASEVGYSDSKYFSKLFTRIVGIKPSGYRKLYIK